MFIMKDMLRRMMFVLLFIILTIVVAAVYQWLPQYLQLDSHYHRPMGDAVKVFETSVGDYLLFLKYGFVRW